MIVTQGVSPKTGRYSHLAARLADIISGRREAAKAARAEFQDLEDLIAAVMNSANVGAGEVVQIADAENVQKAEASSTFEPPSPLSCPVAIDLPALPEEVSCLNEDVERIGRPASLGESNATSTSWAKTPEPVKFATSISVAEAESGVAFSLNLSPAREKAMRGSSDPARMLAAFIGRAFSAMLGGVPAFGFALQFSPEDRLHAHGVYVPGDFTDRARVGRALRAAGGALKGHAGSRQLCLKDLFNASGWARYIVRGAAETRLGLGTNKTTFMSAELRSLTREAWSGAAPA